MLWSPVSSPRKKTHRSTNEQCRDPTTGKAVCGLGPDFCGKGCISTCDYKSECDPGWGAQWSNASTCPLNVCCSKFGFCGTTPDFCNGVVTPSPQCNTRTADEKLIGYYEGWNMQRPCGSKQPWTLLIHSILIDAKLCRRKTSLLEHTRISTLHSRLSTQQHSVSMPWTLRRPRCTRE